MEIRMESHMNKERNKR